MATLNRSTNSQLATGLNRVTVRRIVEIGDGVVTTPGTTGYDLVTLADATRDTKYAGATALSPISLGIDNILFRPLFYPEAADILAGEPYSP